MKRTKLPNASTRQGSWSSYPPWSGRWPDFESPFCALSVAVDFHDGGVDHGVLHVRLVRDRLKQALPPALAMAVGGAWLVVLVKPQFEVGRYAVDKGGDMRDAEAQHAALSDISNWLNGISGWDVLGMLESPIAGGDGDREFLVAARKA